MGPVVVRLAVLLGLAAWLGVLAVRARRGHDHTLLIAFVVVAILSTGFLEARWVLRENQYERVAEQLVERDVTISCQRSLAFAIDITGYQGFVPYPSDGSLPQVAHLRNDTCRRLGEYASSADVRRQPSADQIAAVHVLTHESMHLRGEKVESAAECQALQRDARTAVALGATSEQASHLALAYYELIYPRMPDGYRSPDCHPGGALDEHLAEPSSPFTAGSGSSGS